MISSNTYNLNENQNELKIFNAKNQFLGYALFFLIFAIGATIVLVLNWLNQVFFTGQLLIVGIAVFMWWGAISSIKHSIDKRAQVIINDQGVFSRRWRYGLIPWDDIAKIGLYPMGLSVTIAISLKEPDKYNAMRLLGRIGPKGTEDSPFILDIQQLDKGANEVQRFIKDLGFS